eukprot:gene2605-15604_t
MAILVTIHRRVPRCASEGSPQRPPADAERPIVLAEQHGAPGALIRGLRDDCATLRAQVTAYCIGSRRDLEDFRAE